MKFNEKTLKKYIRQLILKEENIQDMSLKDVGDKIYEIEEEIAEQYGVEPGSTMADFYTEDENYNGRYEEYKNLKEREKELEELESKSQPVDNTEKDFYFDSSGKRIYTGRTGRGNLGQAPGYSIRENKNASLKSTLKELYEQEENSSAPVSDENNVNTSDETKEENIVSEMQRMVDGNQFLKGNTVNPDDLIEVEDYVLYASEDAASHILERHVNEMKPGSTFEASLDLRDIMRELLSKSPSESTASMVKWLGVDVGNTVGGMGVAHASPEEVANMEDYTMPDGRKEQVKVQRGGVRAPTSEVSLITAKLGQLSNGKTALSLVTMFPGGTTVDGVTIPPSRADFAKAGLYFVIPAPEPTESEESIESENPSSKLTEGFNSRRWQRLAGIIKG